MATRSTVVNNTAATPRKRRLRDKGTAIRPIGQRMTPSRGRFFPASMAVVEDVCTVIFTGAEVVDGVSEAVGGEIAQVPPVGVPVHE
jgi:hypothetical protein